MKSDSKKAEELFDRVLQFEPGERAAFLAGACGNDVNLRRRVEDLLMANEAQTGFLADDFPTESSATLLDESELTEGTGTQIGRYKLLEKLGEGGFGSVWAAEQKEPVRRRVALKIIKLGMDTKQVVARFEAERQALALMDHPNIAKVLDAGATDTGRPYFVMELVKGMAITTYCNQEKLDTNARLDLFIKVCQAIQHAHQKGIIHRDIKPSNIMVTLHDGVPVPKVIDFGIAKATQQELTEKTIYTQYSQFIGTPAYMSPEQAEMSGLDIDTRSDIYSLGVLLYELLTGTTPFDTKELMNSGLDEMRKIIREREPVRPSTRLSQTLSDNVERSTSNVQRSTLPSDLDWIVMKCLEKDRARRYESANGLSMDIMRHLKNEPIVARPPSTVYRFQKAWHRNKLAYSAGMAVAAALMIGIAVSLWQAMAARRASRQADTARIAEQEQRIAAQDEAERANLAEQREGRLRHEAEIQELVARRRAYAADMLICKEALKSNNLRRARLLLDRQRPKEGEKDLRGWEWRYLWKQCQGDFLSTLDMQGNRLFNAMFADDDNSIVTFQRHGKVGVWNDSTGRENFVLQDNWQGDDYSANSGQLEFSADGEWVGAVSKSNTGEWGVRIWNMRNRSLLAELSISQEPITALAVSPDKRWLAVYIQLEEVSVWNLETKQKIVQFPISRRPFAFGIGAVAFSPDGNTLAIGDDETSVRLVDVGTWTEKTVLPGSFTGWGVSTLDFSPDGRFLAAGSTYLDPRIYIWETQSKRKVATLTGHAGFITDVSFSPDGTRLASASGDQTIKLWNTETWEEVDTLLGHSDEVWSVNFSSDGKRLVTSGKEGQVHIWPATARRQDREAVFLQTGWSGSDLRSGRGEPPDVSPDGRTIVDVSEKGKVRLLEMATLRERPVPDELGDDNFAGVWLSPNEVLIGSRSPLRIKTWNISNNAITTYPLTSQGEVQGFGFSPGSNLLRVGTGSLAAGNFTLTRWDTASRKELASYTVAEPLENVRGLAVSQDGQWLALAHSGQVEVRNMRTGERMPSFKSQSDSLQGLALLSDKLQVVTAGVESPIINVWDFTTQEKLFSLPGHNLVIAQIRVSSDERRMASRTIGQEPVKIWDTEGWNEVASIEGRPGFSLVGLEFLPDGNTFAAVESNLETQAVDVRLFRAPSWEEIAAVEAKEKMENNQPTAQ